MRTGAILARNCVDFTADLRRRLVPHTGDVLVAEHGGRAASYEEAQGAAVMKASDITVRVVLNRGAAQATVWTCDFSYDYVKINADYRS